jgi:predicted DCC family thiol-disulfide oxidoreductase YuxK
MSQLVIVYDADCGFCCGARDWIAARCGETVFEFLPCGSAERAERFPQMDGGVCLDAMQLVLHDGRVMSGDRALPHILGQLNGWRWLVWIFKIPGVSLLAPVVYAWIACHRLAISTILGRKGDGGEGVCAVDDDACNE